MSATVLPAIEVAPGIELLERFDGSGWGWNVITVRLPRDGLLVYSPSWLDEATLSRVAELGTPRILCAPNHFHHLTLERFRKHWPQALTVAAPAALERLTRHGHNAVWKVSEVEGELPAGAKWHLPDGVRSGEVWLSVPHAHGTALLVADAFFNLLRPTSGFVGFMLRLLEVAPGLKVSTTYRLRAVDDVAKVRASSLAILKEVAPTEVAFAHWQVLRGADCGARLCEAIEARWPG